MSGRRLGTLLIFFLLWGCQAELPTGVQTSTSSSKLQLIDRRIEPGRGPLAQHEHLLIKTYPEPVWLLGARVEMVDKEGQAAPPGLLHLATVNWIYPEDHAERFHPDHPGSRTLFRLSERLTEVALPEGYGIPMGSNEPLSIVIQFKNTDLYQPRTEVRARITLSFAYHRNSESHYRPVIPGVLFAAAPIEAEFPHFDLESSRVKPPPGAETPEYLADSRGHKFWEEWQVPRGDSQVEFDLSGQLASLPGRRSVLSTLFAFESVQAVEIPGLVKLEAPRFSRAEAAEFTKETAVMGVRQSSHKQQARGLAYLLFYFEQPPYAEFPELLQ